MYFNQAYLYLLLTPGCFGSKLVDLYHLRNNIQNYIQSSDKIISFIILAREHLGVDFDVSTHLWLSSYPDIFCELDSYSPIKKLFEMNESLDYNDSNN